MERKPVFHFFTGCGESGVAFEPGFGCCFPMLLNNFSTVLPSHFVGWSALLMQKKPPCRGAIEGVKITIQKPMTPATVVRSGFRSVWKLSLIHI